MTGCSKKASKMNKNKNKKRTGSKKKKPAVAHHQSMKQQDDERDERVGSAINELQNEEYNDELFAAEVEAFRTVSALLFFSAF